MGELLWDETLGSNPKHRSTRFVELVEPADVGVAVVIGQALQLRDAKVPPVTKIALHESRPVTFLQDIRHDSILLNLNRLRDAQALGQAVQLEEMVIAQQLLARLTGEPLSAGPEAVPVAR